MPTQHISYSWRFDELSEAAQRKAVETVAGKLGGDWWDQADTDDIGATIQYQLAEVLKSPGWDTVGEGDFPGIDGVTVQGWDLDRGDYVSVGGALTRKNAPGLAWPDHAEHVELHEGRNGTGIDVEPVDLLPFTCTCGKKAGAYSGFDDLTVHLDDAGNETDDTDHPAVGAAGVPKLDQAALDAFEQVVRDALSTALKAAREAAEYKSSAEAAKDWIEANEPQFTEEGDLF
jgi:hypothetical protein